MRILENHKWKKTKGGRMYKMIPSNKTGKMVRFYFDIDYSRVGDPTYAGVTGKLADYYGIKMKK